MARLKEALGKQYTVNHTPRELTVTHGQESKVIRDKGIIGNIEITFDKNPDNVAYTVRGTRVDEGSVIESMLDPMSRLRLGQITMAAYDARKTPSDDDWLRSEQIDAFLIDQWMHGFTNKKRVTSFLQTVPRLVKIHAHLQAQHNNTLEIQLPNDDIFLSYILKYHEDKHKGRDWIFDYHLIEPYITEKYLIELYDVPFLALYIAEKMAIEYDDGYRVTVQNDSGDRTYVLTKSTEDEYKVYAYFDRERIVPDLTKGRPEPLVVKKVADLDWNSAAIALAAAPQ